MTQPATILVCDDEAAIRSIVATKLRAAGYTVCEGRNGLEGYCWVDHSALPVGSLPKSRMPIVPDLVVTDLQMPMMSGLEMAIKLREFAATAHVPIIMLTARGYIAAAEDLAKANIRHLMPKPFGAAQLLERVQNFLASSSGGHANRAAA